MQTVSFLEVVYRLYAQSLPPNPIHIAGLRQIFLDMCASVQKAFEKTTTIDLELMALMRALMQ